MARCGMGAQGSSGTAQTLMDSFLANAQSQLYWAQDWKHLQAYNDKSLGVGQNQLDYPDGCALNRRVLRIETVQNGQWRNLVDGIRTEDWSLMETRSYPIRFERLAQVLIYPKANAVYTVRFWYVGDLAPFTADGHRSSMDDDMVLLHAVSNAKAHYRHPDAQMYQGQLAALMAKIRGDSFTTQGVVRRDTGIEQERRPAVVGRDV